MERRKSYKDLGLNAVVEKNAEVNKSHGEDGNFLRTKSSKQGNDKAKELVKEYDDDERSCETPTSPTEDLEPEGDIEVSAGKEEKIDEGQKEEGQTEANSLDGASFHPLDDTSFHPLDDTTFHPLDEEEELKEAVKGKSLNDANEAEEQQEVDEMKKTGEAATGHDSTTIASTSGDDDTLFSSSEEEFSSDDEQDQIIGPVTEQNKDPHYLSEGLFDSEASEEEDNESSSSEEEDNEPSSSGKEDTDTKRIHENDDDDKDEHKIGLLFGEESDEISDEYRVGTHFHATDNGAKEPFPATIVEPGVVEDGKFVWIVWHGEKKKLKIPIKNLKTKIDSTKRETRRSAKRLNGSKRKIEENDTYTPETSDLILPHTNNHPSKKVKKALPNFQQKPPTQAVTPSPRKSQPRKLPISKKNFVPFELLRYEGEPVVSYIVENNDKTQYMLKYIFDGNMIKEEGELNGETVKLDKEKHYNGKTYQLLISKFKKKSHTSAMEQRTGKRWYVAYYVGGDGISCAADVQRRLEEYGNFDQISMLRGKMCSRLEMLVSPASSLCKNDYCGLFKVHKDEFELVDENEHEGCGFAPHSFFDRILNRKSIHKRDTKFYAMQVRIFSPALGWFKGILMKKPSITRVQLPTSMLKVNKSKANTTDHSVYVLVKQCFPGTNSKTVYKDLMGQAVTKTELKNIKPLGHQYKTLLVLNGLTSERIDAYTDEFTNDKNEHIRPRCDSILFGVADPTSQLPKDSIFVKGFTREHCHWGSKVFITRYPCTEKNDGVIIDITLQKPLNMTHENWNFLQSIPFGIVVFGQSSTEIPLPVRVNDGDLDGDPYHLLWHKDMVEDLILAQQDDHHYTNSVQTTQTNWYYGEGPNNIDDCEDVRNNNCEVVKNDNCEVVRNYDCDHIPEDDDRDYVMGIINDRNERGKHEVLVRWKKRHTGVIIEQWHSHAEMKDKAYFEMAEYARTNIFNDEDLKPKNTLRKWNWAKKEIHDSVALYIQSHEAAAEEDDTILNVQYDDGIPAPATVGEMKEDEPEMLFTYAEKKNILIEWREQYLAYRGENWFEEAQDYAAELKLLYHQAEMKERLHRLLKELIEHHEYEDAEHVSQAFKESLDFRKHGTKIKLPFHLITKLPKPLQRYILNTAL